MNFGMRGREPLEMVAHKTLPPVSFPMVLVGVVLKNEKEKLKTRTFISSGYSRGNCNPTLYWYQGGGRRRPRPELQLTVPLSFLTS